MYMLKEDKEFWVTLTTLQAQVNPEKIDDHFKKMKRAFYPYLVDQEERQKKVMQKRLVDMSSKGTLVKFRTEPSTKQQITNFVRQTKQIMLQQAAQTTQPQQFKPEPRRR